VTPIATSSAELPPPTRSALEMVNEIRARKSQHGESDAGLKNTHFVEESVVAAETRAAA
jgi:hypothetical protein